MKPRHTSTPRNASAASTRYAHWMPLENVENAVTMTVVSPSPIAPPSSCTITSMPVATAVRDASTTLAPNVIDDVENTPAPIPSSASPGASSQYCARAPMSESSSRPNTMSAAPSAVTTFAPNHVCNGRPTNNANASSNISGRRPSPVCNAV